MSKCWMEVEIGGTSAGVISFALYDDVVPRTARVSGKC